MSVSRSSSAVRLLLAAVVIIFGAYWAGGRWGAHQPVNVQALPLGETKPAGLNASLAQKDAALTDDESINVRIYRQTAPAVANVLTKATQYDFFMDPVPVEGAGSGFIIDKRGYILTNFHVVQEAQSIEVVLGDQSRYPAKFIGADQRNDVALLENRTEREKSGDLAARGFEQSAGGTESSGHRQSLRISEHVDDWGGERVGAHGADQRDDVYR